MYGFAVVLDSASTKADLSLKLLCRQQEIIPVLNLGESKVEHPDLRSVESRAPMELSTLFGDLLDPYQHPRSATPGQ